MMTPLRRSARLQQGEDCIARNEIVSLATRLFRSQRDCFARNEIVGAGRKKRCLLPSPSISGSFGEQVGEVLTVWVPLLMHVQQAQRLQHLDPHRDPKEAQVASVDVGLRDTSTTRTSVDQVSGPGQGQKRKTVETEGVENSIMQQPGKPPTKRTKSTSFVGAPKHSVSCDGGDRDHCHPIQHWASTGL